MALTRQEAATTLPGGLIGAQQMPAGDQAGGRTYTFREAAARRKQSKVYVLNWSTGNPLQQELRHVGYLSELFLKVNLTITVGTAGTVQDAQAQENYLPLIQLVTPSSNAPHTLSLKSLIAWNYRRKVAVNPRSAPGYANWVPGTASAQAIQVTVRLPIGLGDGRNFDTGLIARNTQQAWYLNVRCAAPGDLVGTGTCVITTITGTIEIGEVWYDAVGLSNVIPPDFLIATRLRESIKQTLAIGDNTFIYPTPGPTLLDALHLVRLNGAPDHADIDTVDLTADGEYTFDKRTGAQLRDDNYQDLGQVLPTGWVHFNFYDDADDVNASMGRDQIDATLYSQLLWNVRILTGATLGTVQDVTTLYRELVDLQLPAVGR